MSENILLQQPFNTPYQTPPFSKIKLEDYLPAIQEAIQKGKAEIKTITENPDAPNFNNTIEALESSGETLNQISSIFFNLNAAETCDKMQEIAQKIAPLLSEYNSDVILNESLFRRIESVYKGKENQSLQPEQEQLLEKIYKNFVRNGALLGEKEKQNLREIDQQLATLSLTFAQNVLAETNAYQMHLTSEEELEGLPEDQINKAKEAAQAKGLEGGIITLQMPSYLGFMKYANHRKLREQLYRANGAKAFQNNIHNNTDIVLKIVKLRDRRAKTLGYATYADFVLEERMAETPQKVNAFLEDLLKKSKQFAVEDVNKLAQYARKVDGIQDFMPWDHAYYAEKVRQECYQLKEEELKPYFKLENVVEGAFLIAKKLYQIVFRKVDTIEVYHPEVATYEVLRDNKVIGIFYTDFFSREGKRAGAWMTSFRNGYYKNGEHQLPLISIVCNFAKPIKTAPSLLTFNEVTTLFHEFGHALHGLLANTQYESLSGTNVSWDFVELPSQFMENFCYEPQALALFAKHYETEEIIPKELVEKVVKSAQFMEGYQTIRQVSFGLLDMAWHTTNPNMISDVDTFEQKAFESTRIYPKVEDTNMSTAFSHIFQGGYASGYYSYKWAEVLDADAFDYFKQNGIFNPKIAEKFYRLLSSGGTVEPMKLYLEFRGKEPNPEALLKRAGLVK